MVGEMSSRGNVLRGSVWSGNCRKMSVGEVFVGDFSSGKCQSGKCPVGKLSYNRFSQFCRVACNRYQPFNPLSANPTKWSNTLKQVVGRLPTNCLSVFDHFVGLALEIFLEKYMSVAK